MEPKYHMTEDQIHELCTSFYNYLIDDDSFSLGSQYRFLEKYLEDLKEE